MFTSYKGLSSNMLLGNLDVCEIPIHAHEKCQGISHIILFGECDTKRVDCTIPYQRDTYG